MHIMKMGKLFDFQYTICLHKAYFDVGVGLTRYLQYALFLIGIDRVINGELKNTLIIFVGFGIFCYIAGRLWFKTNFVRANAEVSNRFNYFQQEMREVIASPNNETFKKSH